MPADKKAASKRTDGHQPDLRTEIPVLGVVAEGRASRPEIDTASSLARSAPSQAVDEESVGLRVEASVEPSPQATPLPPGGPPPGRVEHLRWSCELLWSAFEHETTRTDRIRDQATAAFFALPVFVGLAMQADAWRGDAPGIWICRVLTFACSAWALVAWYLVARVDYHPRLSVELFNPEEERGREQDCTPLVERTRDYLRGAVEDGQRRGSELARRRRIALLATVAAMMFAGLPLLLKELR